MKIFSQDFFTYACLDLLLSVDIHDQGLEPQHHLGNLDRKGDRGLEAHSSGNLGVLFLWKFLAWNLLVLRQENLVCLGPSYWTWDLQWLCQWRWSPFRLSSFHQTWTWSSLSYQDSSITKALYKDICSEVNGTQQMLDHPNTTDVMHLFLFAEIYMGVVTLCNYFQMLLMLNPNWYESNMKVVYVKIDNVNHLPKKFRVRLPVNSWYIYNKISGSVGD